MNPSLEPRKEQKGLAAVACNKRARAFHQTSLKRCGLRSDAITKSNSNDVAHLDSVLYLISALKYSAVGS
jgi:hypothetical protein